MSEIDKGLSKDPFTLRLTNQHLDLNDVLKPPKPHASFEVLLSKL